MVLLAFFFLFHLAMEAFSVLLEAGTATSTRDSHLLAMTYNEIGCRLRLPTAYDQVFALTYFEAPAAIAACAAASLAIGTLNGEQET